MKLLDQTGDGQILVPELRWAMTKLGDVMDEAAVDDMIKELDSENKGCPKGKLCENVVY